MYKRIVTVLTLLIVFLSSFTYAPQVYADEPPTKKLTEAGLLEALGIYTATGLDEGYTKPISRGVFIDAVIKMAYPGMTADWIEEPYFADVDEESSYYNTITVARNMGLVSGVSYRKFAPEESIKADHALGLVVKVLGYEKTGIASAVAKLGLTRNFRATDEDVLTEYNMIMLLYKVLTTDIMEADSAGNYRVSQDITILNSTHHVRSSRGIVTANQYTGLLSASAHVNDGEICIENQIYKTEIADVDAYIGLRVEAYYQTDNDEKYDRVIYISVLDSNSQISFDAKDASFADNTYTVSSDSARDKHYVIGSNSAIIHNEKANYIDVGMLPENGKIELIDNDADGSYDVVKLTEYQTHYVMSVNHDDYKILTDDGVLEFDEEVACTLDGKPAAWEKIDAKQVISVVRSSSKADRDYCAIHASTATLEGTIEQVNDDTIIVSGQEAELLPGVDVSTNTEGVLCLDFLGRVAYVDNASQMGVYGYMLKMALAENLTKSLKMKILTADGTVKIFELKDTIKLNGVKKSTEECYQLIDNVPQLIKYHIGADDKISSVMTEALDGLHRIEYDGPAARFMYRSRSSGLGESKTSDGRFVNGTIKYFLDANTKVFFVSKNIQNEKKLSTGAASSLKDGADYNIVGAYSESDLKPCDAIVIDVDADGDYLYRYTYLLFVSKVTTGIDADGTERVLLKGIYDGNPVSYFVDLEKYPHAKEIKQGDVLQIEIGNQNELNIIKYVYSMSGKVPDGFTTSEVYLTENDGLRGAIIDTALVVLGKITNRNGNIVEVEYKADGNVEKGLFSVAAGKYYIYTARGGYAVQDDRSVPFETDDNQWILFHVRSGGTFEIALINK